MRALGVVILTGSCYSFLLSGCAACCRLPPLVMVGENLVEETEMPVLLPLVNENKVPPFRLLVPLVNEN